MGTRFSKPEISQKPDRRSAESGLNGMEYFELFRLAIGESIEPTFRTSRLAFLGNSRVAV